MTLKIKDIVYIFTSAVIISSSPSMASMVQLSDQDSEHTPRQPLSEQAAEDFVPVNSSSPPEVNASEANTCKKLSPLVLLSLCWP